MRYLTFGTQGKKASQVVLGLMRVKDKNPTEVARLIDAALESDINMLDTAPIYGPSEKLIGSVFAATPHLREKVLLQSKLGIRDDPTTGASYYDFSKEHIFESVDKSLRDLRTDHLDVLLLHRPDVLMEPSEIGEAFAELRRTGKVVDFGVSNQNPAMMQLLEEGMDIPLVANQVQLSLAFAPMIDAALNINRGSDDALMRDGGILEYCRRRHLVIQAWSPLQYGNMEESFLNNSEYQKLNVVLRRIAGEYCVEPIAVAVAWVLRYPGDVQAIVGTTRPNRVREAARACDFELTRTQWYELYRAACRTIP